MNRRYYDKPARTALALGASWLLAAGVALGQAVTLTDSSDTTLRGGAYANVNYGSSDRLETRASDTADYRRRVILKFDTHTTIPQGATIGSARLTLTIAGGNSETRVLSVYRVTQPFTDVEATWNIRRTSTTWSRAGGDLGEKVGALTITNVPGSKVSVDLTAAVQRIVNGTYGSNRYTRLAVVDEGTSSRGSYKQYYSEQAGLALGPALAVVLATAVPVTAPPATTIKVMDWNIHHGVDTYGANNLDRVASQIANIRPHVVSLNEVELKNGYDGNADEPAVLKSLLQSKTGQTWYSCFAQRTGSATGQGNLLLSPVYISSCHKYYLSGDRSVANATITVNGRLVSVFSTHLDASSASMRTIQISQLKTIAAGTTDQAIVMGDFNASPGSTEIREMVVSYSDSWAEAMKAGTAVAYAGNEAGNTRNGRIDYVFLSRAATALTLTGAQVYDTGTISDHRPVSASFDVR
jgi:endonuclease/exonuclease/phosphatase family metal-dependent hydrolase